LKGSNLTGDTLLHISARQNRQDIFEYLLGLGLDSRVQNQVGVLPQDLIQGDPSSMGFGNKGTVVRTKKRNYILPKVDQRLADFLKKERKKNDQRDWTPSVNVVGSNEKKRINFEEYAV
jgi:hypothetical protein